MDAHALGDGRERIVARCSHTAGVLIVFAGALLMMISGCDQGSNANSVALKDVSAPKQSEFRRDIDEKEPDRIRQHHQYVRRSGTTLELVLANGKETKLTDFDELGREGEWTFHRFVDYLKDIDHFLVRQHYYEGVGFTLIDRKYGSSQKIDTAPNFSPDRKHFVTVSICEAHCPYRLQIWKRNDGGGWFEMVWSYRPYESLTIGSEKWLDNTRIELSIEIADLATSDPSKGKYNYVKKLRYLQLQQSGWSFIEN